MIRGILGDVYAGLTSANLKKALDQGISAEALARVLPPELQAELAKEVASRAKGSENSARSSG